MAAFGTGIGTSVFKENVLIPNTELGHLMMDGMIAENYAANSIRENENLSWEEWGKRVNEYLMYIESLFYPELIIIGGGVSKDFNEFNGVTCYGTKNNVYSIDFKKTF